MPSELYIRELARCTRCTAWWSTDGELQRCPCGGELRLVIMDEHRASLPYSPHVPDPPKPKPQ